jgi:hypothetical protein
VKNAREPSLFKLVEGFADVRGLLGGGGVEVAPDDFAVLDEEGLALGEAFGVGTPKALATAPSLSAMRVKGRLYLTWNFFWASSLSSLTPRIWRPRARRSAKESRRLHASLVQPGVSAFG